MTDQTPSTDLVRQQSPAYSRANLSERQAYVRMLATAGDLLPDHLKGGMIRDEATNQMKRLGDVGKAFLLAETGDMLGIHPIAAVTGVHIIEGRPSISANLMGGLVRKVGHKLRVKTEGSFADGTLRVTATLVRADDPDYPFVVVWDIDKAKRAELLPGKPKSNWQKYPDAMMKARAISEVIREGAPDVLTGGNVYTAEELGAEVDEQGEPINLEQVRDDAPQAAPPAAAPAAPRPETPIPDEPATEATVEVDWATLMEEVASSEGVRDLYRRARSEGQLNTVISWGTMTAPLGQLLERLGRSMSKAEEEEAAREQEAASAAGADDDPNIQDADVVDENPRAEEAAAVMHEAQDHD